jgi:hypothetical protein
VQPVQRGRSECTQSHSLSGLRVVVRGIGTCAPRPLWDLPANLSNLALLATVQTVQIECQHSWGEGNDPAVSFGVHEGRW